MLLIYDYQKLDSFLIAVSCCSGKILYVSDRVEKLLGHAQVLIRLPFYCFRFFPTQVQLDILVVEFFFKLIEDDDTLHLVFFKIAFIGICCSCIH